MPFYFIYRNLPLQIRVIIMVISTADMVTSSHRNVLLNQLTALKGSLSTLVTQLNADSSSLAQNKIELTDVINRIANLKSMLANLEVQLKVSGCRH